jgi:hypothetical protein
MKPWWQSKTIWFNILVAMGAAGEASLNVIQGYFDPRIYYVLLMLVPAINVVLRFISTQAIGKQNGS